MTEFKRTKIEREHPYPLLENHDHIHAHPARNAIKKVESCNYNIIIYTW